MGHTCCKARSRAIHRALEPLTRPWEYCRPSRTMAGWITEDGMLMGWAVSHTLQGNLSTYYPLAPNKKELSLLAQTPPFPLEFCLEFTLLSKDPISNFQSLLMTELLNLLRLKCYDIASYLIYWVRKFCLLYWGRWEKRLTLDP